MLGANFDQVTSGGGFSTGRGRYKESRGMVAGAQGGCWLSGMVRQPMVHNFDDAAVRMRSKVFMDQLAGVLIFIYIVGP